MLRRTLLPITEHRRHHQHADHRRHASYQPGERRETGKPAVVHPHFINAPIRVTRSRRVFSASVLWKSSFGTTMATAGSGFSSSISGRRQSLTSYGTPQRLVTGQIVYLVDALLRLQLAHHSRRGIVIQRFSR